MSWAEAFATVGSLTAVVVFWIAVMYFGSKR